MIQVQLKIEEFFDGEIEFRHNNREMSNNKFVSNIYDIIAAYFNMVETLGYSYKNILKPNESRETIIQALWEYQKNLLPKICYPDDIEYIKENMDIKINVYKKTSFWEDNYYNFYDPDTRTITITKFEEGER